ncbi:MAG TPA: nucleotidyltransferase domain-containing protein [Candidatus Hydrogenedentes bacterium]|nr:nucleotidyltransferase domain-containing protein [Candidatus Hydrogenedentota bacterium]
MRHKTSPRNPHKKEALTHEGRKSTQTAEAAALAPSSREALSVICARLRESFPVEVLLLFGSVVRGEQDEESDTDLLDVTSQPMPRTKRRAIADLVFDVNMDFDTNVSAMVVDKQSWDNGAVSILPLHDEVKREGVSL